MRGPLQFLAVAALCQLARWEDLALVLASAGVVEALLLAWHAIKRRQLLEAGLDQELETRTASKLEPDVETPIRVGVPPEPAPPPPPRPRAPADP